MPDTVSPIAAAFRNAVDHQLALWGALRRIEAELGFKIDLLGSDVARIAATVNYGSNVSITEIDKLEAAWRKAEASK